MLVKISECSNNPEVPKVWPENPAVAGIRQKQVHIIRNQGLWLPLLGVSELGSSGRGQVRVGLGNTLNAGVPRFPAGRLSQCFPSHLSGPRACPCFSLSCQGTAAFGRWPGAEDDCGGLHTPELPPRCVPSRDEDGGMLDTCRGEMFMLVVTLWRTLINYFEESPFLIHTKRDLSCYNKYSDFSLSLGLLRWKNEHRRFLHTVL